LISIDVSSCFKAKCLEIKKLAERSEIQKQLPIKNKIGFGMGNDFALRTKNKMLNRVIKIEPKIIKAV
tara:strand:+ start:317 stop:520 length:204 start_codon:yes stop_codon:yes gene_type:complete